LLAGEQVGEGAVVVRFANASGRCGMTLHLIKLCVGAESLEDLAQWQSRRLAESEEEGQEARSSCM
jgi:hypothetical protein